jgi:hypothetical protein
LANLCQTVLLLVKPATAIRFFHEEDYSLVKLSGLFAAMYS